MKTKDILLKYLLSPETKDGFISGEELARKCGVTRTSVWKAIELLRKQGADIQAVTKRGYKLNAGNLFNAFSVEALIPKEIGSKIIFFNKIDSTNSEAKRRLIEFPSKAVHKNVIIAAEQSAGRGRLGRKFYSPADTGIYLSIIYSSKNVIEPAFITASAASGVCRALKKVFNIEAQIKWVNDIYFNGKKICGILTEGISSFETGIIESTVIGIGVNIAYNPEFPKELLKIAGGIIDSSPQEKRSKLCASIIEEIINILDGGEAAVANAISEYKERSFLIGKTVEIFPIAGQKENSYICTVQGITDEAKLIVKMQDGQIKIFESGEISLHGQNYL